MDGAGRAAMSQPQRLKCSLIFFPTICYVQGSNDFNYLLTLFNSSLTDFQRSSPWARSWSSRPTRELI